MARATFYYHRARMGVASRDAGLQDDILRIYHTHKGRYGIRRITAALCNEGFAINHKRVERIMKELGVKSLVRPKRYRSYKGTPGRIVSNVLQRDFVAHSANEKWATDVTEFKICGKKIYLSPILDMYNGEIISYTLSYRADLKMVTKMVKGALRKVKVSEDLIIHSDQGWQYQNSSYQRILSIQGITQSMSRKANCLDNAKIESFFAVLKSELLYLHKFNSVSQFESSLKQYIKYYNNDRIKLSLKAMSPIQYRTQYMKN